MSPGYAADRNDGRVWTPTKRSPEDQREMVDLTEQLGLEQSRARLWRLPPGVRGRRHVEHAQEEVFLVLEGTLTLVVGDPPERLVVDRGGVAAVHVDTPLQVRNEGDVQLEMLIYGAPPVTGQAEFLDEAEPAG